MSMAFASRLATLERDIEQLRTMVGVIHAEVTRLSLAANDQRTNDTPPPPAFRTQTVEDVKNGEENKEFPGVAGRAAFSPAVGSRAAPFSGNRPSGKSVKR